MKLSAQMTMIVATIFALICFGVAIAGFSSIGEMTDPVQISDSKGFAMFWAFLGLVASALAGLSVWIVRTAKRD